MSPQPDPDDLLNVAIAIAEQTGVEWGELGEIGDRLQIVDRIVRGHEAVRASTPLPERSSVRVADPNIAQVRWGPLVVREKIGSGSFGVVYRAWDPKLDRDVALKVLDDDRREPDAVVEEARSLARVHHPNVVTVHGAERIDGRTGIWMEFVAGQSLALEVAARGPLPPRDAARVGVDVCRALAAVHAAGLLHRDVKAQNVIRAPSGRIVLGDFGTSIELDDPLDVGQRRIAGTPLYLPPEVLTGARASTRSDLYSVGVLMYFLTTGTFPVSGRTPAEIREAHSTGRPVRLREARPDVPNRLSAIVDRLLDPEPARRFDSADAVVEALAAWIEAETRPRVRRHAKAIAALSAALVAVAAWLVLPWDRIGSGGVLGGVTTRLIENAPCDTPRTLSAVGGWVVCDIREPGAPDQPKSQRVTLFSAITGETRGAWRSPDVRWHPTISPDGRHIAAAVPTPDSNGQPREIRVFEIASGQWRTVATLPPDTFSMMISGWGRADDRLEVYLLRSNGTYGFALVSPRTGGTDVVLEFPVQPSTWSRSADGRWLAFSSNDGQIRVCRLDPTSRECAIVAAHPATDFLPFFAPDGSLLFSSDRGGTIAVWHVDLDGLQSRSAPIQVRDMGRERLFPIGFSAAGDLYYLIESGAPDVLQVDLTTADSALVRSLTPPIRTSRAPGWSPDGNFLAYLATRGNYTGMSSLQLIVQSLVDGRERQFEIPEARFNSARLAWSPDSRTLAVRTIVPGPPRAQIGLLLVDRERGPTGAILRRASPIERFMADPLGDFAWLNARTIVFTASSGVGTLDVLTRRERSVLTVPSTERVVNLALSPDRTWLALTVTDGRDTPRLRLVPLPAASKGRSLGLHHDATGWAQTWTADGEAVLVTRSAKTPSGTDIGGVWRVPVDGSLPMRLSVAVQGLYEVRAHRDGRRLAISTHALRREFFVGLGR